MLILIASTVGCSATRRASVERGDALVVAFVGDSLTRGAQLPARKHYPALLEKRFARIDLPIEALNAGFPGDTSAGVLARLDEVLRTRPAIVLVAVGVNDASAGLTAAETASNLAAIVERVRAAGAAVVVAAAKLGQPRADRRAEIVAAVARDKGAWLVGDLLEAVAGVPELNLSDGIHPNAAGQRRVADNVWPVLFAVVAEESAARARVEPNARAARSGAAVQNE